MLHGAPSPLLSNTPLDSVLAIVAPRGRWGAWVRGCRHTLRLRSAGQILLAGSDLGSLLRTCDVIVVRREGTMVAARAHELIAWRTLRIATALPCLAALEQLRLMLPDLAICGERLTLPIGLGPPEEALAACASAGVPVVASWVEYRR
jgi:hypothetical protein